MGGGGSGGAFTNRSPSELRDIVRKAEEKSTAASFDTELSRVLGTLLANFNNRNTELASERLDEIKRALEGSIAGTFDRLFGGSVAKHTYVDGLSDIDSIVILNGTGLEGDSPQVALRRMAEDLRRAHADRQCRGLRRCAAGPARRAHARDRRRVAAPARPVRCQEARRERCSRRLARGGCARTRRPPRHLRRRVSSPARSGRVQFAEGLMGDDERRRPP